MYICLDSFCKVDQLKQLIGNSKISILSPTTKSFQLNSVTELDRLSDKAIRPQFDTRSMSSYFTTLFQYCIDDNVHEITCIIPTDDSYFSSSHFQVLLGKAYLQVTRAILYHEITFTVIQYPMVESRSETMIVPHLKLKHILLKSIASILFPKIEKRQFDQVPDPIKKPRQETRILQASYLICEPTVPDNYLYPENSLGAMYCQVNEKQLFGRVYGMNVEDQVVNSPRKKQRV